MIKKAQLPASARWRLWSRAVTRPGHLGHPGLPGRLGRTVRRRRRAATWRRRARRPRAGGLVSRAGAGTRRTRGRGAPPAGRGAGDAPPARSPHSPHSPHWRRWRRWRCTPPHSLLSLRQPPAKFLNLHKYMCVPITLFKICNKFIVRLKIKYSKSSKFMVFKN